MSFIPRTATGKSLTRWQNDGAGFDDLMEKATLYEVFLKLTRLGIGETDDTSFQEPLDGKALKALAKRQGLFAVVSDGLSRLPVENKPPKKMLLQWIGAVVQDEARYALQQKAAAEMALLFHANGIRTYVLKGAVIAECYPKPEHRVSVDVDCFLLPEEGDFDAWSRGNQVIESSGFSASVGFYKNSTFHLSGVTVENHRFMTPFRGNDTLRRLEILLQKMMRTDLRTAGGDGSRRFAGTFLWRPPVMVSALFLIEHAYSHFLHEGLTWRLVLDWMMFSRKHKTEMDWTELDAWIDKFGFRKFYDSYGKLGRYLLGEIGEADLGTRDKRMLADVWSELDLHKSLHGIRGKLALVGNTWRARWKYRYFSEISMIRALWMQVCGFLFIKHPQLDKPAVG